MRHARIAVAQLDADASDERLRRQAIALGSACVEWAVDLLVVPAHRRIAELFEALELPAALALLDGDRPAPGLPEHAVLTIDEFVLRDPACDHERIVAARRGSEFLIVRGAWSVRDRRQLERVRRPVFVCNEASVGGTGMFARGRERETLERGELGVLVVDRVDGGWQAFARAGLLDPADPSLAEYAAWNREIVAALERGELDLAGARERVDAASALLMRPDQLDARRRDDLRRLLIRLDELDSPAELLAYLREVWLDASQTAIVQPEPPPSTVEQLRSRPSLRGADLRGIALEREALVGLDLREARLDGARLAGCDLERADLRDASLRGADLRGARLWQTRLDGADLRDARLDAVAGHECSLVNASFEGAEVGGSHWTFCDWKAARTKPRASLPWLSDEGALARRDELALRLSVLNSNAVAWSPDGELLALTGHQHLLLVRPVDRRYVAEAECTQSYSALAWSPDGRELAVSGREVELRTVPDLGERIILRAPSQSKLVWSPCGAWLATVGRTTQIWSTRDGSCRATLEHAYQEVRWSRDGGLLLAHDGVELRRFRSVDGHPVPLDVVPLGLPSPGLVRMLGDGERFVCDLFVHELSGARIGRFERDASDPIRSLAVSPDATLLAAASSSHAWVWACATGRLIWSRRLPVLYAHAIAWSNDNRLAFCGASTAIVESVGGGAPIRLSRSAILVRFARSDAAELQAIAQGDGVHLWTRDWTSRGWFAARDGVEALAWAPDGRLLAVAHRFGRVELRDSAGELRVRIGVGAAIRALGWSRDGARLHAFDAGWRLHCWAANGRPLTEPITLATQSPPLASHAAFCPATGRLAVASIDGVEIFELAERPGESPRRLFVLPPPQHAWALGSLSWSPDGAWLAQASYDQLRFARVADASIVSVAMRGAQRATPAWSRDGTRVAVVSETRPHVRILARDDFRVIARFEDELPIAIAWAHDDRRLLFNGRDGSIELADSRDGTPVGRVDTQGATALLRDRSGRFAIEGDPREVELIVQRRRFLERARYRDPLAGVVEQQDREKVVAGFRGDD